MRCGHVLSAGRVAREGETEALLTGSFVGGYCDPLSRELTCMDDAQGSRHVSHRECAAAQLAGSVFRLHK